MSTASEVAGPGFGEETGRVPGATSTLMTNGSQIVSGGTGRGERDVGLFVRVLLGLCGNPTRRNGKVQSTTV